MKNERLAQQILEFLGGTENIESITHCATRLRPSLKKRELVQSEKIELLDGVTGVVNKRFRVSNNYWNECRGSL